MLSDPYSPSFKLCQNHHIKTAATRDTMAIILILLNAPALINAPLSFFQNNFISVFSISLYNVLQLLVFIAVTAFNKRGPHGRLVFTKCVLPSVNKVYYYYYYYYYGEHHEFPFLR